MEKQTNEAKREELVAEYNSNLNKSEMRLGELEAKARKIDECCDEIHSFHTETKFMLSHHQSELVQYGSHEDLEIFHRIEEELQLLSAYRGQLVVNTAPLETVVPRIPLIGDALGEQITRSASIGPVMLLSDSGRRVDYTIEHEHGHFREFLHLGPLRFFVGIGIPSARGGGVARYYSQPWEIIANILGGVNRRYSDADELSTHSMPES